MSSYKSFAIVGGGTLGFSILSTLAAKNVQVLLLSRRESATKEVPAGVKVAKVDYKDVAAVAAVLKEHQVDVVLSTVGHQAIAQQKSLADASKQAGTVRLFVPSEYGMPTDGQSNGQADGPLGEKSKFAEYLKSIGVPSARIFTGGFMEYVPLVLSLNDKKIVVVGKGEVPASFTAISDIAGFVAHILTTLSPSQLENKIFRLEGERSSLNALGPLLNATIEHVDRVEGEGGAQKTWLLKLMDSGLGSTGFDATSKTERTGTDAAGSANALWPGHQWKTIKEVLNL